MIERRLKSSPAPNFGGSAAGPLQNEAAAMAETHMVSQKFAEQIGWGTGPTVREGSYVWRRRKTEPSLTVGLLPRNDQFSEL